MWPAGGNTFSLQRFPRMIDAALATLGIMSSFAAAGVLWLLAEIVPFIEDLEVDRRHHEELRPGWKLRKR